MKIPRTVGRGLLAVVSLATGTGLAGTGVAWAQRPGGFEVGLFVQPSYFDRSLQFDQARAGPGARIGFFVTPAIELEGEAAYVPTEGANGLDVRYLPLRARLLFNLPAGDHGAFLIGGGYTHIEYTGDADGSDDGATALAGVRLGIPGLPSIRLASYLDWIPSPQNGAGDNINWGLQAGLSLLLGRRGEGTAARREAQPAEDSLAMAARRDSLANAARADSLARVRADSARAQAARDSVERTAADSARKVEEAARAREEALRDSLAGAAREDSIRGAALRDSLRLTRNAARRAALQDSLDRVALRDSLRMLTSERAKSVTLRGVNFETGNANLLPASRDILQDVARSLVANPEIRVEVAGHTDNTGPRALNERLSRERAEAVQAFLIENGVEAGRMEVRGYAWDHPVASNKTRAGRAQNRRVELRRVQ